MVKGAGGPEAGGKHDGGTIRVGGRVPWGAEVEFAYTTGYDSRGRVSVNHIADERDCSPPYWRNRTRLAKVPGRSAVNAEPDTPLEEGPDRGQDFGGLGVGQAGDGVPENPLVHGHHPVGTHPTPLVQPPGRHVGQR